MSKSIKNNFLLIVLDATRYDALLSKNGEIKKKNIKKLGEDGAIYHNAFATSAWTPPSHASMFTGLYPPEHGVLCASPLDKNTKTIAEVLKEKGYYTFGVSNSPHTSSKRNFNKGFVNYFEIYTKDRFKPNISLFKSVLKLRYNREHKGKFLKKEMVKKFMEYAIKNKKPFFGFFNLGAAHSPYNAPERFKSKKLKKIEKGLSKEHLDKIKKLADREGYKYIAGKVDVSEEEWRVLKMMYSAEISFIDDVIGDFVNFLKNNNVYEDTTIILTADHGENLGDHELAYHQFCLYNSLINVPLIIKPSSSLKDIKGGNFSSLVSLIDIPYSIADSLNIPFEGDGINILSKETAMKGHSEVFATYVPLDSVLAKIKVYGGDENKFKNKISTIITEKWKFIENSDKEDELYNIEKDFNEEENVIDKYPKVALDLKNKLSKKFPNLFNNIKKENYEKIDEAEAKKRLKELGYI